MYKCMAVNAGSSSLKYKLFEMPEEQVICSGIVDRIGHDDGIFKIKFNGKSHESVLPITDHAQGVQLVLDAIKEYGIVKDLNEISCVGHRIVQGGKYFSKSALFDKDTEAKITKLIPLDPLHAPAHLVGFHAFKKALPNAISIAVFDTAFHQTMKPEDYLYPIPYEMSEEYDCRRYGAHGTSHNYLAAKAIKDYLGGKPNTKIISCHIGSGASLCAVYDGKCVATSMGLTPLGGVMMGTRSGDLDPSVVDYLCDRSGKNVDEIYEILNKKSGLLGVSGVSNDTRDIEAAIKKGDKRAIMAGDLFVRRIADFVGQYYVRLGGADMIVFSAGIGENSSFFRARILAAIAPALGITYDLAKNEELNHKEGIISKPDSKILVAIIPTDEEVMIARDCYKALKGTL
ncbi:MAG: acetate kinase [Bacilli bacterium]|nr:acetate kinase [Bacilli bacterium]MCI2111431.1 acetate kinase [Bacilli bacterium]